MTLPIAAADRAGRSRGALERLERHPTAGAVPLATVNQLRVKTPCARSAGPAFSIPARILHRTKVEPRQPAVSAETREKAKASNAMQDKREGNARQDSQA
jgi:hypothetical protein